MATPTVRNLTIAAGDAGTRQTLSEMAALIRAGSLTPAVRDVAVTVAGEQPDPVRQLAALRYWLAAKWQFIRDPSSGELLHDTAWLLRDLRERGVIAGDCDDAAILGGALAASIGFRVALVVIALRGSGTDEYSHVWASASPPEPCTMADGRQLWIELDITRPMQRIPLDRVARAEAQLVC
jgi:hypothetical protein